MGKRVTVWPGEFDRKVRLEDGRRVTLKDAPSEGYSVPWSSYIQRRINCGDLSLTDPRLPKAANQKTVAPTQVPAPKTETGAAP